MAAFVGLFATAHAPGQTALAELPPDAVKDEVAAIWAGLRARMRELDPDLIVAIANDHFQNFYAVVPPFCVGTGEAHRLPDDGFAERLRLTPTDWPGAPEAAAHLLRVAQAEGPPLAYADRLSFMDEFALPFHFMDVSRDCRLLPVLTNCLHRHRPSPRNFLRLGQTVARSLVDMPDAKRVVVLVTGGLSHDPFGPDWGLIDETFDRRFLHLIEQGDAEALMAEITRERIDAAGVGGTPEVMNWFCAVGAAPAGVRPRIHGYAPVSAWSTGLGYVEWPIDPAGLPPAPQEGSPGR